MLKGQWLVHYNPKQFQYITILELLPTLHHHLESAQITATRKEIIVDPTIPAPVLTLSAPPEYTREYRPESKTNSHLLTHTTARLTLPSPQLTHLPTPEITTLTPLTPYPFSLPQTPQLQNIHLAYPTAMNDKRWDTIRFTSSSLFLGSMLTRNGFTVTTGKQTMPMTPKDLELSHIDLLGLTLFEDLFKETEELLEHLNQTNYKGLIAAGGPLITLNPLETARLLPELNLLVRGECEMVLPQILKTLKTGDLDSLLQHKGLILNLPGILILSEPETINRPHDFSGFHFDLDFLQGSHLENGLEINLSRGCRRGCIFCSRVQGRHMRQLPVGVFDHLLRDFANKVEQEKISGATAKSININDDDILQDPEYADAVFSIIRVRNFKLWGIQTSVNSFFTSNDAIDHDILELTADRKLYMDNNPLIWCGTDAFLPDRGKRLGKHIPQEEKLMELLEAFETKSIRHYHYWISSDFGSHWGEFLEELRLIHKMFTHFPGFGLIGHAPFLVPYPSTPVYRLLMRSEDKNLIKYRNHKPRHRSEHAMYQLPLVDRAETHHPHLNRLLKNEKMGGNSYGFFDLLKQKAFADLFILTYNFLKTERLTMEATNPTLAAALLDHQNNLEEFIGTLI